MEATGFRSSALYQNLPHRRMLEHFRGVMNCDIERLAVILVHGFDLLNRNFPPGTMRISRNEIYWTLRAKLPTRSAEIQMLLNAARSLTLIRRDGAGYYLSLHPNGEMCETGKRIAEALLAFRDETFPKMAERATKTEEKR